ncbi:MAG: tRNA-dihydrouridine synthase family protein [Clostridiales bacterium]|nr:tRNA-dihydrouridine synthase family protein [Clostridiales bacterium]
MNVDFAPLQSLTDAPYRRLHAEMFGSIRKYYLPFISPTQNTNLTNKEKRDADPVNNIGLFAVPQILANDPSHFLFAARMLCDLGWKEVNLNAGCPASTVTTKGKGAGLLREIPRFEAFLDEVFAKSPLPISIKTRIGWSSPDEFPSLLALYNRYPVHELIIHVRTRSDYYGPSVHPSAFCLTKDCNMPVVYNGDLSSVQKTLSFLKQHPFCSTVMIGRGLLSNPALSRELQGGAPLTIHELRCFHDRLYETYEKLFSPVALLGRMREYAKYMACSFEDAKRLMKEICKAGSLKTYREAVDRLFDSCPLRTDPGFQTDGSAAGHASA